MATLEQINLSRKITFYACRYQDDSQIMLIGVDGASPIIISGDDSFSILNLMKSEKWRHQWEDDLQCISKNNSGDDLLSSWMSFMTFRDCFLDLDSLEFLPPDLLLKLSNEADSWKDKGVEVVEFSGVKQC